MRKRTWIALIFVALACVAALAGCNALGKIAEIKIAFVSDGQVMHVMSVSEGLTPPADPVKAGYRFDGWYWDENAWSDPLDFDALLTRAASEKNANAEWRVYAKFVEDEEETIAPDPGASERVDVATGKKKTLVCERFGSHFCIVVSVNAPDEEVLAIPEEYVDEQDKKLTIIGLAPDALKGCKALKKLSLPKTAGKAYRREEVATSMANEISKLRPAPVRDEKIVEEAERFLSTSVSPRHLAGCPKLERIAFDGSPEDMSFFLVESEIGETRELTPAEGILERAFNEAHRRLTASEKFASMEWTEEKMRETSLILEFPHEEPTELCEYFADRAIVGPKPGRDEDEGVPDRELIALANNAFAILTKPICDAKMPEADETLSICADLGFEHSFKGGEPTRMRMAAKCAIDGNAENPAIRIELANESREGAERAERAIAGVAYADKKLYAFGEGENDALGIDVSALAGEISDAIKKTIAKLPEIQSELARAKRSLAGEDCDDEEGLARFVRIVENTEKLCRIEIAGDGLSRVLSEARESSPYDSGRRLLADALDVAFGSIEPTKPQGSFPTLYIEAKKLGENGCGIAVGFDARESVNERALRIEANISEISVAKTSSLAGADGFAPKSCRDAISFAATLKRPLKGQKSELTFVMRPALSSEGTEGICRGKFSADGGSSSFEFDGSNLKFDVSGLREIYPEIGKLDDEAFERFICKLTDENVTEEDSDGAADKGERDDGAADEGERDDDGADMPDGIKRFVANPDFCEIFDLAPRNPDATNEELTEQLKNFAAEEIRAILRDVESADGAIRALIGGGDAPDSTLFRRMMSLLFVNASDNRPLTNDDFVFFARKMLGIFAVWCVNPDCDFGESDESDEREPEWGDVVLLELFGGADESEGYVAEALGKGIVLALEPAPGGFALRLESGEGEPSAYLELTIQTKIVDFDSPSVSPIEGAGFKEIGKSELSGLIEAAIENLIKANRAEPEGAE